MKKKKEGYYQFPLADEGLWGSPEAELIKRRRLQMLVHSCLYYEMSENIWTDHKFDAAARELAQLMTDYPDAYSDRFDDYFKGWDGSSGFDLPHRDPWVYAAALNLLNNPNLITK